MMFNQPQKKMGPQINQPIFPKPFQSPMESDPIAAILAQREIAKQSPDTFAPIGQQQTVSAPYVFGAGGKRISMEDITDQRKRANAMMAAGSDYSPVQHWTQGLARVAQGLLGGLESRRADKAAEGYRAQQQADIASVMGSGAGGGTGGPQTNPAIIAGLSSDDAIVQNLAMRQYERANPKPVRPHYWEANNGSLFSVGADGTPSEVYHDPTPKMNFIPDGLGGGQWVALPTTMSASTAPPSAPAPAPAIGTVIPDPRKGGGVGNGTSGFR